MLRASAHAWTMLSSIIGVGSVDDGVEVTLRLQPGELSPELGLAVIAPISGIAQVSRILKLISFELDNRYIELRSQAEGSIGLDGRIRGTPANDRKKAIDAERLAAYHRKQARIHAAGVSQDNTAQRGEMTAQMFEIGHSQKRNGGKRDRRDK